MPKNATLNCFPGSATVELANGDHKELKHLDIHDRVRTGTGTFHAVETFFHRDDNITAEFVVLYFVDGAELALSDGHFVWAGGRFVRADQVRVGDALSRGVVVAITRQDRRGIYAPITEAGTIVVNGCVASCYSNVESHEAAHLAVRLTAQFTSLERLNDTTGHMNPHLAELAAAICM